MIRTRAIITIPLFALLVAVGLATKNLKSPQLMTAKRDRTTPFDLSKRTRPPQPPSPRVLASSASSEPKGETPEIIALKEILASKNDNDPRLDTELKSTSPEVHQQLISTYRSLPPEQRNQRGLIAFLIARDLKSDQDVEFLREVINEPACLGLKQCDTTDETEAHDQAINETTLLYPQLVILHQLESHLRQPSSLIDRGRLAELLRNAEDHQAPKIQRTAERLRRAFQL